MTFINSCFLCSNGTLELCKFKLTGTGVCLKKNQITQNSDKNRKKNCMLKKVSFMCSVVIVNILHWGILTGVRKQNEIFYPYVPPYAVTICKGFILMDDNAKPHHTVVAEDWLSWGLWFGVNRRISSLSRPESDTKSLGVSWQKSCCCMSSSKVIRWARTRLAPCLVLTSLLVSDNLIDSI